MKDMAVFLLQSLLGADKQVDMQERIEDGKVYLTTKVAAADKGKVIGKDGCIVHAVRTVLGAAALVQGKKVFLKIED